MRELVGFVARALVDNPEAVTVDETEQEETLLLELRVAQPDLGKVIGRQGRTARAIRTLLTAVADQERKVRLEIVE
ncbi:KH domain-containing protein [Desulfurivibrio dismutans]|uniref:KH domain-containing protein n=1 Tax=Desulfurivibrio dismutans TaxID=1398908 RepID=UPI0023DB827C|nr:KH domain-containing protein [Desulfurivibrio alkaliphilus]MDF1614679.1 KH domain-containing protein [Desulfurivibrio alkaliphilus]